MARLVLDASEIPRKLRPEIIRRSRQALVIYRRSKLIRDQAGYPFAQREEDKSIRDPNTSSVRPTRSGVQIRSTARGARFVEGGNDAGGDIITGNLALPLQGRARAFRKAQKGRKVVIADDGKAYLLTNRVHTYRGKHLLENAVSRSFNARGHSTR